MQPDRGSTTETGQVSWPALRRSEATGKVSKFAYPGRSLTCRRAECCRYYCITRTPGSSGHRPVNHGVIRESIRETHNCKTPEYDSSLSITVLRRAFGRDGDNNVVDAPAVHVDDLQRQVGPRRTIPDDGDAAELGLHQPADSADLFRNRRPKLWSSDRLQQIVHAC